MPYAQGQGARIYYEETGAGTPILFIHEFGGDHRSWADQMRHFGRGWRCITFGARGYPPSDCPQDEALYGQVLFNRDSIAEAATQAAKISKPLDNTDFDMSWRKKVTAEFVSYSLRELSGENLTAERAAITRLSPPDSQLPIL